MTPHTCTADACGHVVTLWCRHCVRVIARVRAAHMRERQREHDLAHHAGTVRPTQAGARA